MAETQFADSLSLIPPSVKTLFAIVFANLPILILLSLPIVIYLWAKYKNDYWRRNGVPYIPGNLFVGNLLPCLTYKKSSAELFDQLYNDSRISDQPAAGIHYFHKPALIIRDPELMRLILVKDFSSFQNRHWSADPHSDRIGNDNLFFVKNPAWRNLRARLTPVFTSGKMRKMFELVDDIGNELDRELISLTDNGTKELELKDFCARYSTDVIASCAYGVTANSMRNPDSQFRQTGRNLFKFNLYRGVELFSMIFLPEIIPFFRCKLFSNEVANFLRAAINNVIAEREKSELVRNDLIDTLIMLKREDAGKRKTKSDDFIFEGDSLVAQAAIFFLAGFETSSTVMSFSLFELAWQPDLQDRLRTEIRDVLSGTDESDLNQLSYDTIYKMEYLHMVVSETLRMYPPLPFLDRICTLDNLTNGGLPKQFYDLNPILNFKIPIGMPILVPIQAIQRDPKYFPNPNHFEPERFSSENKSKIMPYTYMPFGAGPHNCIGDRFGLMQAKVGLINFLKSHTVRPSNRTPRTIQYEAKSYLLHTKGGLYLNIDRQPLFD